MPQKIVATGMSVILAFGLSPIGQAPAYAEEVQAGESPELVTQATQPTEDNALTAKYTLSVSDVTFDGHEWADGTFGNDRLVANNFVKVTTKTASDGSVKTVIGKTGTENTYYVKDGSGTGFYLTYKDPKGNVVDATHPIYNVGTYTATLEGRGAYQGEYATATFQVKPYDLNDVKTWKDGTFKDPSSMQYMGKPQAVHYDSGDYPQVESAKDVNGTTAEVNSDGSMTTGDLPEFKDALTDADINFEPPTVTDFGVHTVTLEGKGNYKGTKTVKVNVTRGVFASTNTTINGQAVENVTSGGAVITLAGKCMPTVADPNPVADGKVVYGETALKLGSDYTVKYYKGETLLKAAPTEVGTGYTAVLTAVGSSFESAVAKATVTVNYDITLGGKLAEMAYQADFGSAIFIEETTGAITTSQKLVQPTNVKFYSETGLDITAAIGDNWRVYAVEAWDADDELEFLGEAGYKAKYPYEDAPYQNTALASTVGYQVADEYVETIEVNGTATTTITYGFNGLPAGDYKVYAVGANQLPEDADHPVYGKFTIEPATAAVGTAAGQLTVKKATASVDDDGVLSKEPTVTMNTGKEIGTGDATYSDALKQGSEWAVSAGKADYFVTYMKDGQVVVPEADGTYDAVFTFGGGNYAGTVTVSGALEVGKVELADAFDIVCQEESMYTGNVTAPKLTFYKKGTMTEVKLTEGVDYTVSYRGVSGEAGSTPKGLGEYKVFVSGAGKYTSEEPSEFDYEIKTLNLEEAVGNGSMVVEFKDGDSWTPTLSVVADPAKPAAPEFRIVTKASKVVVDKSLYTSKYDYNALNPDGTGEVGLTITPNTDVNVDDPTNPLTFVAGGNATASFRQAAQSFNDASVKAAIEFTPESGVYDPAGQDLTIKVKRADGVVLAPQYADSTGEGQYVVTVYSADGKLTRSSIDYAEADFAAALKAWVVDAGDYKVVVSGGQTNQYAGTVTSTFTVAPKEIKSTDRALKVYFDNAMTDTKGKLAYTGKTVKGVKKVTYVVNGTVVEFDEVKTAGTPGNNYLISGNTGIEAGNYTATIEFTGNYTGTVEQPWSIVREEISDIDDLVLLADGLELFDEVDDEIYVRDNKVEPAGYYVAEYNGAAHEPTVKAYKAKRYTYTAAQVAAMGGVAKVFGRPFDTIYGEGYEVIGYSGIIAPDGDYFDLTPVQGLEYTYLYSDNVDATPYPGYATWYLTRASVTLVSNGGNYTGRVTGYFPIKSLAIGGDRVTVSFDNDDLSYTGKPVEPKGTLTYTANDGSTFVLTPDKDYTVTYTGDNVNVGGKATAKFTGLAPNFVAGADTFVTADFTVAEPVVVDLSKAVVTLDETPLVYNGKDQAPAVKSVTVDGKVVDPANYVVSGTGKDAGKYNLTIAAPLGSKLTTGQTTAAFEIAKANNTTLKVTAKKKKFTYKKNVKKTFKAKKLYTVSGNKGGGVVYAKANKAGKNKITVGKKGKITCKKALANGTYKVKVKYYAKANKNYNKSKAKYVTIKIVKKAPVKK